VLLPKPVVPVVPVLLPLPVVPLPVLPVLLPDELPPEEPVWAETDIDKGTAAKLRVKIPAKTNLDKFKGLMIIIP
jgi:hypothetical protein